MRKLIFSLIVLALVGSANALLLNGDFENTGGTPPTVGGAPDHWNPVAGPGHWGDVAPCLVDDGWGAADGMTAVDGTWWLHLGNGWAEGSVSQAFATTTGQPYEITFCGYCTLGYGDGTVSIDAGDLSTEATVLVDVRDWQQFSYTFTATDTSTTLTLGNTSDGDGNVGVPNIDAVSVVLIPEPATMVLLGLGGLLIRRKR